jgi:tetratricopeptide (TPR) repeat protein
MKLFKLKWFLLFLCLGGISAFAQSNEQLARQLFEDKSYDKAILIYEELVEKHPQNQEYYENYIQSLIQLNDHKKALKHIKKTGKKSTDPIQFMVDECWVLSLKSDTKNESDKLFSFILEKSKNNLNVALLSADLFKYRNLSEKSIQILQQAEEIFGDNPQLSNEIALLYLENGNRLKALERYLDLMVSSNIRYEQLKQIFDTYITDSADIVSLQQLLMVKIQQYPNVPALAEWLKWTFVNLQDWEKAFIYARSLDKRLKEDGRRVYDVGILCFSNQAFNTAEKCFAYCVSLGENGNDFSRSQTFLLQSRYNRLKQQSNNSQDWILLMLDCKKFISENGPVNDALPVAEILSEIYIQRLNNSDSAISILEPFIDSKFLQKTTLAKAKIALADVLTISGDVWQSELLLAQVEKSFTEDNLGQTAKFKRAELSFYRGDYEWANMQLDVLKGATSRVISNDAMELSLCITDNLGVDSNYTAMNYFSKAKLFQKMMLFDSSLYYANLITVQFPSHSLGDDVLYLKAKIAETMGDFERAKDLYNTLIGAYPNDILVDNAYYFLAQIYQFKLNNPEKAKEAYQNLIEKHTNSIFIVDSRNQFRKLRGF